MSCICHLYSMGDLCSYCQEQYASTLDPALWSEDERELLYKRHRKFVSDLPDSTDAPKADPKQQLEDAEKLRKWVESVRCASSI